MYSVPAGQISEGAAPCPYCLEPCPYCLEPCLIIQHPARIIYQKNKK